MDKYEAIIAFTGIIFGTGSVVTIVFFIAQAVGKLRKPLELPEGGLLRLEQRMERMEQAIDAMAVEMERVSEGQRFTTKLLSERPSERIERSV
jgi:hypothetical protein